ncbi:MAG TPA: cysteine desulfurase [Thermoanaerobaculia bacterium]|nr:cysteine desulfurase [Thermoanaerobaculia bacterium]
MTTADSTANPTPGTVAAAAPPTGYDVEAIRAHFPSLDQEVHGHPLVYLDTAASAQRPLPVIEAMERFERTSYANVHRGVHTLSQRATEAYEASRARVARFLGATDPHEAIFVRGTTEGLNLVAQSWGRESVGPGDVVVVSEMEHHSNLVPWQLLCSERGADIRVLPVDDAGDLRLEELDRLLEPPASGGVVRAVAVTHVSNSLGTINDIGEISRRAHAAGAIVVVDGAQAAPHLPVDVGAIGCDFYAFSGHKAYGPSGIGVLWGRRELLDAMPPWQGGGGMIERVSFAGTTFARVPERFEAGTPYIVGAVGLAAALDFLEEIGLEEIGAWEHALVERAVERLSPIAGLRLVGTGTELLSRRAAIVSFLLEHAHAHDVGTFLDQEGIAVRTGHHCNQPLMERYGIPSTSRASFAIYNTLEEVDRLAAALQRISEFFA